MTLQTCSKLYLVYGKDYVNTGAVLVKKKKKKPLGCVVEWMVTIKD